MRSAVRVTSGFLFPFGYLCRDAAVFTYSPGWVLRDSFRLLEDIWPLEK